MDKVKLCKDCRHYEAGTHTSKDICRQFNSKHGESDYLVRGIGAEYTYYRCESMRAGLCGIDGQFWEPRAEQPTKGNAL